MAVQKELQVTTGPEEILVEQENLQILDMKGENVTSIEDLSLTSTLGVI